MNFPGFIGPSATTISAKADCERTINLQLERIETGEGVNAYAFNKAPGLLEAYQADAARVRGMLELNDHVFAVVGSTIYEILYDPDTQATSLVASYGPIVNDNGPVFMAADPDTLGIVSAENYYAIQGGVMTQPALTFTPISIAFISGYWVLLSDDLRQFYFSEDPLVWDAADVQTAEANANDLIAMMVDHQTLFIFGNRITQAFLVGSDADTPFVPQENGVVAIGLAAPAAVTALADARYWLGRSKNGQGVVYQGTGYEGVRISTHAVENAIRGYGDISDCVAWAYQLNGHSCVRFTFPAAQATWEYDVTSGAWTECLYWNATTGQYEAHRGYCAISAFNKVLVGDRENGKIYELSPAYYDDNGDKMRWLRRTPHLIEDGDDIIYDRFTLLCNVGNGLDVASTVDGYNPQVMFRYSDDGGETYSNELMRSTGRLGAYRTQVFWDRLGIGRDRVFEVSGTDPVKVCLTGAALDAAVLV